MAAAASIQQIYGNGAFVKAKQELDKALDLFVEQSNKSRKIVNHDAEQVKVSFEKIDIPDFLKHT